MIRLGILTISDKGSRGERIDKSGETIKECLASLAAVIKYDIVPDEKALISARLKDWCDSDELDLVLTTGGTGLAPRDVTPEATLSVVERLAPGLTEAMRAEGVKKTPTAILSRAVAGTRRKTLIINLPGSPRAVAECLEVILPALPHAIATLRGEVRECADAI